jgi:magnesium chelatase subunit I
MTQNFPFTAIVGLERAKRSLIFHAIDPRLGGTVLLGHRGCAKTTLARAFATLLPDEAAFVEVPLGATEDRLLGSVDAQSLLDDGKWRGQRGLIEQAHGGVLYIDEVNLLADHLADFILDSAATGQYRMERDGLTRQVESRYILVGSMNPDEGDLRPQLSDRFAHGVRIADDFSAAERVEIVKRRIAFDDDPHGFAAAFSKSENALRSSIHAAREQLNQVVVGDEQRSAIAEKARAIRLEGMRAELAVLRTARAAAALDGRKTITNADLDEAWELCLGHREGIKQPMQPPPRDRGNGNHGDEHSAHPSTPPFPRDAHAEPLRVEPVRQQSDARLVNWWKQPPKQVSQERIFASHVLTSATSRKHISWMASLVASVSRGWRPDPSHGRWQLRFRSLAPKAHGWLFLDASRSAGAKKFLAHARNAVSTLAGELRATRWNILVLQNGCIKWKLRRATGTHVASTLARITEVSGKSDLSGALKILRREMLRRGASPKDRVLLCSDGLVTRSDGESVQQTISSFRDALRRLSRLPAPILWLHPPPARGMASWLARIAARIPITRISAGE